MDWCYGDAVFNNLQRDIQLIFEEFNENLLRREELNIGLDVGNV